jgi:uncharacterized DUF497 family protein
MALKGWGRAMGAYEDFEWDDDKDLINREKHGLRLIIAAAIFSDPYRFEITSQRSHATEHRIVAIGSVRERLLTSVYVWRGSIRRIISLRTASRKERRAYQEANEGRVD